LIQQATTNNQLLKLFVLTKHQHQ